MLTFFVKTSNFQLTPIEKKTSVGFIPTSKVLYMKRIKFGLIKSSSDFIKFHHEIDKLKSILHKNSYPRDLVDKCIKELLHKILAPKPVVSTVSKKDPVIALPYLGKLSLQRRT